MYTSSKDMNVWSDGQLKIARLSLNGMHLQRDDTMCVCVCEYTQYYFATNNHTVNINI